MYGAINFVGNDIFRNEERDRVLYVFLFVFYRKCCFLFFLEAFVVVNITRESKRCNLNGESLLKENP